MTDLELEKLFNRIDNWATFRWFVLLVFIAVVFVQVCGVLNDKLDQIIKILGGVR